MNKLGLPLGVPRLLGVHGSLRKGDLHLPERRRSLEPLESPMRAALSNSPFQSFFASVLESFARSSNALRTIGVASMLSSTIGCGPSVLAIEVLPARTSATCSAPAPNAAALGRGLLDVAATERFHGSYIGDIRLTSRSDVVVDSLAVSFTLPEGALSATTDAAEDASTTVAIGDAFLVGDEDEVRTAVIENVELLPRVLAVALRTDSELGLSDIEYATVVVNIQAVSNETTLGTDPSTFAIDVCDGCLVVAPAAEDCPGGISENVVCRKGQDKPLFTCRTQP
jgi:hypothetical protein